MSPEASLFSVADAAVSSERAVPRISRSLLRVRMRVVRGVTSPSTLTARFSATSTMRSWKSTFLVPIW